MTTYLEKLQAKKARYEQDVKDFTEVLNAAKTKLAVVDELIDEEQAEQAARALENGEPVNTLAPAFED